MSDRNVIPYARVTDVENCEGRYVYIEIESFHKQDYHNGWSINDYIEANRLREVLSMGATIMMSSDNLNDIRTYYFEHNLKDNYKSRDVKVLIWDYLKQVFLKEDLWCIDISDPENKSYKDAADYDYKKEDKKTTIIFLVFAAIIIFGLISFGVNCLGCNCNSCISCNCVQCKDNGNDDYTKAINELRNM